MKLKTATLLAVIGTGLATLQQLYFFIRYNIIERGEYNSVEGDINLLIYILIYASLCVFLITFYQKQNNKLWKD